MRFPFGLSPKRQHEGPHYADIYTRAMAAGIDMGILFYTMNDAFQIVSAKIFAGTDVAMFQNIQAGIPLGELLRRMWESHFLMLWLINSVFQLTIMGMVVVACQVLFATTPGKWIMGIKIVRAKTLEPIAAWRYMLRLMAYAVAILPAMIGIFWISFNREHRGWHDFIAGTAVLNMRPPGWYWGKVKQGWLWSRAKIKKETSAPVE